MRRTYLKPDEEKALKKLAIKKTNSKSKLYVYKPSEGPAIVKPVPCLSHLHLRMQMMSSEDQPDLLTHARTTHSLELK